LGWRRMSEIDDVGMMYDAKRNFSTCKNGQNPAVQGSFFWELGAVFGSYLEKICIHWKHFYPLNVSCV
jgi:hypothetical protein